MNANFKRKWMKWNIEKFEVYVYTINVVFVSINIYCNYNILKVYLLLKLLLFYIYYPFYSNFFYHNFSSNKAWFVWLIKWKEFKIKQKKNTRMWKI